MFWKTYSITSSLAAVMGQNCFFGKIKIAIIKGYVFPKEKTKLKPVLMTNQRYRGINKLKPFIHHYIEYLIFLPLKIVLKHNEINISFFV